MGTFQIEIGIGDPQGERYEYIDALVDSGSTYNILPARMLRDLGVEVQETGTFKLADGRRMRRDLGQTWVRLDNREYIVPVIFGANNVLPLLGAVTLEIFRLGIDPVEMRLIPLDGLMVSETEITDDG